MHPLNTEDVEDRQSEFLRQLHGVLGRNFRFGPVNFDDIRPRSIVRSMHIIEDELADRNNPVPQYALAANVQNADNAIPAGRSQSYMQRMPSQKGISQYGQRQPSMYGPMHGPSFYGQRQPSAYGATVPPNYDPRLRSQYGMRSQSYYGTTPQSNQGPRAQSSF